MSELEKRPGPVARRVTYIFLWVFYLCTFVVVLRQRATGPRPPKDGPFLLLSNHSAMPDPIWVSHYPRRPIWYMASGALFRIPVLRRIILFLGAFPKQKFVRDTQAMTLVDELYADGGAIAISPEGTRTWDGRGLPVRNGIGRLVKRLNARVVICRVKTGFLIMPRWAKYPRWVPLHLEYDPVRSFPPDMSAEEITREIAQALRVDPHYRVDGSLTLGFRTAHGLSQYLWACPACFAQDQTGVSTRSGNHFTCGACGADWKVTVNNDLLPLNDAARATGVAHLNVARAFDRIAAHYGEPPISDPERYARDGVALLSPGSVSFVPRNGTQAEERARGELRLTDDAVTIYDESGEAIWTLPFMRIKAISIEVRSVLQLFTDDGALYQLDPEGQSPLKWSYFMRHRWHMLRTGGEGPPPPA